MIMTVSIQFLLQVQLRQGCIDKPLLSAKATKRRSCRHVPIDLLTDAKMHDGFGHKDRRALFISVVTCYL